MSGEITYRDLLASIKEKAIIIAEDYPNIENCTPWEQLYAIANSYEGTSLANKDCHKLIDVLRQKLGMTKEELVDLWLKVRDENKGEI